MCLTLGKELNLYVRGEFSGRLGRPSPLWELRGEKGGLSGQILASHPESECPGPGTSGGCIWTCSGGRGQADGQLPRACRGPPWWVHRWAGPTPERSDKVDQGCP